jgi:hypothetical protein
VEWNDFAGLPVAGPRRDVRGLAQHGVGARGRCRHMQRARGGSFLPHQYFIPVATTGTRGVPSYGPISGRGT